MALKDLCLCHWSPVLVPLQASPHQREGSAAVPLLCPIPPNSPTNFLPGRGLSVSDGQCQDKNSGLDPSIEGS